MRNLNLSTRGIYNISLFNVKKPLFFDKSTQFDLDCSLTQKGFTKKNLFNFIFFLVIVTKRKPFLVKAKKSNAFLKIRKDSLIQAIVKGHFAKKTDLSILFLLTNLEKHLFKSFWNPYFIVDPKYSHQISLKVFDENINNKALSKLIGQAFIIKLNIKFKTRCLLYQRFLISSL